MTHTKKTRLPATCLVTFSLTLLLVSFHSAAAELPPGWFTAGSKPQSYIMGIDKKVFKSGSSSAFIKSKDVDEIDGFGTLMQNVAPDHYKGHRIRLSGYAKSKDIERWAGLWMRVDPKNGPGGQPLAFDNMQGRPIAGTTDWKHYEIVLDVAEEASNIAFGFLLDGKGTIWVDGLSLEIVSKDTPVTGLTRSSTTPQNLDFEQ